MGRSVLTGLLIGTLAMAALIVVVSSVPPSSWSESFVIDFFAVGFVSVLFGGVPGTLVGLVVGAVKQRSRRTALPHQPPPRPLPPPLPQHVPQPGPTDRWAALAGRAELSVRRVHAVVATVPASPARTWMERIAAQFEAELANVWRIAELGRALGADQNHPVSQRLHAVVGDFTAFENEVGRVALQMFDQPSLDAARVHLELLEQQLPHLGDR
ncbi:hypothetical protein FHS29_001337 [Saccharothrix tamanrassetensis]|uniref:Uncharacterized protein n=1 Tax=Saccharothrix tamanrassetensis TaxID=1051531 RepID=A0A841CF33_9PSEU|nr:hypothetical protein [Saccharothrix tamanrassetensis]MBB5954767.1 hypothetical protein [Saccharothrix tamanrassetensis]